MSKEITAILSTEKETKNTIRFAELEREDGLPAAIGTLYIQKYWIKQLGNPQKIEVTIKAL